MLIIFGGFYWTMNVVIFHGITRHCSRKKLTSVLFIILCDSHHSKNLYEPNVFFNVHERPDSQR